MKEMMGMILSNKALTEVPKIADKGTGIGVNNKMFDYLRYCAEEKVIPLPIMSNINNGVLTLENYKLTDGVSKAIGKFIPVLISLHALVFVNIEEVGVGE
jgi:hypothetical protein